MPNLTLSQLQELALKVLLAAGTAEKNAQTTAEALVAAEADGLSSHGMSRLPFYADQALAGKVAGRAIPIISRPAKAVVAVDADFGFAYPAIRDGMDAALKHISEMGIMAVSVRNSHHFGAAGYHVEGVAERGFAAIAFSNSPAAMAPWGGTRASFGTNPIAFACPRVDAPAMVIDLSLSEVARGKIMVAAKAGEAIPQGWALDAQGNNTTDAKAALAGTMLPSGGAKGAALALMVEILTATLSGSNHAFQASSFFDDQGPPPGIGQLFILLNLAAFNSAFATHFELLLEEILSQSGTRLPGSRRLQNRARARSEGVALPDPLYQDLLRRSGA